jgi:hypothetical protein
MPEFIVGQEVVWHYTTTRGWSYGYDVPGVVTAVTSKRVQIAVRWRVQGGAWQDVRRWVTPGKLSAAEDTAAEYAQILRVSDEGVGR